jgi:hypothetical protein
VHHALVFCFINWEDNPLRLPGMRHELLVLSAMSNGISAIYLAKTDGYPLSWQNCRYAPYIRPEWVGSCKKARFY